LLQPPREILRREALEDMRTGRVVGAFHRVASRLPVYRPAIAHSKRSVKGDEGCL